MRYTPFKDTLHACRCWQAMLYIVRNAVRLLTLVAYTLPSSHASQCRQGAPTVSPPTDAVGPCIVAGLSSVHIAASAG